jgi:hypothetical protein
VHLGTATSPDNLQTVPMDVDQLENSTMFAASSINGVVAINDSDSDVGVADQDSCPGRVQPSGV